MQGISFGSSGFKLSWQPSQLALQHTVRLRRAGIWRVWLLVAFQVTKSSPPDLFSGCKAGREKEKKKMKGEKSKAREMEISAGKVLTGCDKCVGSALIWTSSSF